MSPNLEAYARQYLDNLWRLLLLVQQQIASPTQAGIDAINAAYETSKGAGQPGLLVPRPTYSLDGESYQWDAYRVSLEKSIRTAQQNLVLMGGNFIVRSRGAV